MRTHQKLLKWLLMPVFRPYTSMPGYSYSGRIPRLDADELAVYKATRQHVAMLATRIGERHRFRPDALEEAAAYINNTLQSTGYQTTIHTFPMGELTGKNIVAELPGIEPGPALILGAHYDSIVGCPGANDNASGVAALLEIARILRYEQPLYPVRFVAFSNEEHPQMPSEAMGSYYYAQDLQSKGEKLLGMWSLETMGCYLETPGSQRYPSPFNLYYPDIGNFVAFVGNRKSRRLIQESVRAFRRTTRFPSEGAAAPEKFADIARSDHWGFWKAGYHGLMVTDTANFRFRQYHTAQDTADKVSYDRLALVTCGLARAAMTIASGDVTV